jgi:hypothetical protein
MDYRFLETLRRTHPAWRLLLADYAPLIASVLFKSSLIDELPTPDRHSSKWPELDRDRQGLRFYGYPAARLATVPDTLCRPTIGARDAIDQSILANGCADDYIRRGRPSGMLGHAPHVSPCRGQRKIEAEIKSRN